MLREATCRPTSATVVVSPSLPKTEHGTRALRTTCPRRKPAAALRTAFATSYVARRMDHSSLYNHHNEKTSTVAMGAALGTRARDKEKMRFGRNGVLNG
jgi:hypothetical protein